MKQCAGRSSVLEFSSIRQARSTRERVSDVQNISFAHQGLQTGDIALLARPVPVRPDMLGICGRGHPGSWGVSRSVARNTKDRPVSSRSVAGFRPCSHPWKKELKVLLNNPFRSRADSLFHRLPAIRPEKPGGHYAIVISRYGSQQNW